ncbi:MAG: cytosol nonspecific dipeptidase [Ignavibacteriae bacterium]|nr:MAG: cytosol nonspecific dipeptidase [Ignavibacteriota bacterium]
MANTAVAELEPKHLWKRFYEITQVPRPSKKEEKIRVHLRELLKNLKTEFKEDAIGNIVALLPATPGHENAPTIVLQGHVDMVCEKNKDKQHDFDNDPINVSVKDGWVVADGTTLGSDNGIGVAAGLAIITDTDVVHGPIEVLMTVDEETGLTGANNLEPGFITGKILLNMDSEEDGAFYVGCAGGVDTVATFEIKAEKRNPSTKVYELHVTGLKGGHSGLDIQEGRGNAIKILGRTLKKLESIDYKLAAIEGGSLRNAIPREAEAILLLSEKDFSNADEVITEFQKSIQKEFHAVDKGVKVFLKKSNVEFEEVFTDELKNEIINVILALPHGVISMSQDIPGLVETSTNLATINLVDGKVRIGTSQRSSVDSVKEYIANSVAAVFNLTDADVKAGDGYPGWNPNMDSELLKVSKKVFKEMFSKDPEIKAIHAGLECGILEGKNPGMDMISFGPTIQNAHSPDEKVNVETVAKFYDLLKGILKEFANTK